MSERSCAKCKHGKLEYNEGPCRGCWGSDGHHNFEPDESTYLKTPVTDDKNITMIKSIIDEAMEKRDRIVSIFIHNGATNVTVTPLGEDEPRWIPRDGGYVCSTCGQWELNSSRYCRICGETLKNMDMFTEESEEDDCQMGDKQ